MPIETIMKFGGTSVGSPEAIRQVFAIVHQSRTFQPLVVVSAFSGITDSLVSLFEASENKLLARQLADAIFQRHLNVAHALGLESPSKLLELNAELQKNLSESTLPINAYRDEILSFGERFSSVIIAEYFSSQGLACVPLDARTVITTDAMYGHAIVDHAQSYQQIQRTCAELSAIPVVTGFIARSTVGTTTTLGRGGSDYTASLFGAALHVREIQIWSDVNGICSTDPRVDSTASTFAHLTYQEAFELAQAGAKVIYPAAILPAEQAGIPLVIKNTFNPKHPGTVISIPGLALQTPHAHEAA